jgi:hypothetical protein
VLVETSFILLEVSFMIFKVQASHMIIIYDCNMFIVQATVPRRKWQTKKFISMFNLFTTSIKLNFKPGKPYCRGRSSTVDLLMKIDCFVNKVKYSFSMKSS